jgi:hypothetical protein
VEVGGGHGILFDWDDGIGEENRDGIEAAESRFFEVGPMHRFDHIRRRKPERQPVTEHAGFGKKKKRNQFVGSTVTERGTCC